MFVYKKWGRKKKSEWFSSAFRAIWAAGSGVHPHKSKRAREGGFVHLVRIAIDRPKKK